MPLTRGQTARVMASMATPWRRVLGERAVVRTVQGVKLRLPMSHLLPTYARVIPQYGQNLVQLAAELHSADADGRLQVVDVGANIGDSTLQIIARVPADVLCVEGDPYWARYLRQNVGDLARVQIEEVLLTDEAGGWDSASPVREHGTTRFVADERKGALPRVSAGELRARHPEFDRLRLIKCDTDGFDPMLIPALARAWSDVGPVVFFEYDPALARAVDEREPARVFAELAELGYSHLAIWDNAGDPLGQLPIAEAAEQARTLEPRPIKLGYHFWDVAACRADDASALDVLARLVPEPFSPLGTRREQPRGD